MTLQWWRRYQAKRACKKLGLHQGGNNGFYRAVCPRCGGV